MGFHAADQLAEDGGAFGDTYVDGNVGNELMAPFLLVFDYQQSRIAFRKR